MARNRTARLDLRVGLVALMLLVLCVPVMACQKHAQTGQQNRKALKQGVSPTEQERSLFRSASTGDREQVMRLLDMGTNINAREEENETPLMHAAVEDHASVVELLLDRGAEINAVSINDETALGRAVGVSRYEAVTVLLNRGADVEKGHPLIRAAGNGDVKMMQLLLEKGAKVNGADDEGFTPLAAAVRRQASITAVRALLDAGADPSIKTKRGENARDVRHAQWGPAGRRAPEKKSVMDVL